MGAPDEHVLGYGSNSQYAMWNNSWCMSPFHLINSFFSKTHIHSIDKSEGTIDSFTSEIEPATRGLLHEKRREVWIPNASHSPSCSVQVEILGV